MISTLPQERQSMDSLKTSQEISNLLKIAMAEHQAGNLQSALSKYQEILRSTPNNPDALHFTGLVYYQSQNYSLAIEFIEKAISIAPNQASFYSNLGLAYTANNETEKAINCYQKATDIDPKHADAWNNFGASLFNQGKFKNAINAYKKALKANSNHFQTHNNLGNVYREIKDFNKAIGAFKSALKIVPNYPIALNNLANTFKDIGKTKSAIEYYKKAILQDPNYTDAYKNLGIILEQTDNNEEAITYYEHILKTTPQNYEILYLCSRAYFNISQFDLAHKLIIQAIQYEQNKPEFYNTLGTILTHKKCWDEAITAFNKSIELAPDMETAYINLGSAYKNNNNPIEAEKAYNKALSINSKNYSALNDLGIIQRILNEPYKAIENFNRSIALNKNPKNHFQEELSPANTYNNLGLAHLDLMQLQEAHQAFEKAMNMDNSYPEPILSNSITYLTEGNFDDGWEGYEYRQKISTRKETYSNLINELNTWNMFSSPKNTPLIILPEQGIGDEIMFASIIPDLIKAHKGEIILACDKRLVDIFKRSFKDISVSKLTGLKITTNHQKIYLASIAKFLRKSEKDFAPASPYIIPLEDKKQYFKDKYKDITGLKVGISWKSGNAIEGNKRTVPLKAWAEILSTSDINFFNLQYGETKDEITEIKSNLGIKIISDPEIDPLTDLENFIAIISNLDLIITIDNSTAHIAGALGIPTWVMLPYSCDWRWMKDRSDSIWYKSLKMYRQKEIGKWDNVLEEIHTNLKNLNNKIR